MTFTRHDEAAAVRQVARLEGRIDALERLRQRIGHGRELVRRINALRRRVARIKYRFW